MPDQTRWILFSKILDKFFIKKKRIVLFENFTCSFNVKIETHTFIVEVDCITFNRFNILRLKELQTCIDECIFKNSEN